MLYLYSEPEDEVYNSGYHNQPEHPCAPFVKAWHVPLWRQLYYLFLHAHIHYCIALHTRVPSIAPLYARDIESVTFDHLSHKHTIVHYNGIYGANNTKQL